MATRAQHLAAHRRQRALARWLVEHDGSTAREVVAAGICASRHQANSDLLRLEFLGYLKRTGRHGARWSVVPSWVVDAFRGIDTSVGCTCTVRLDGEEGR